MSLECYYQKVIHSKQFAIIFILILATISAVSLADDMHAEDLFANSRLRYSPLSGSLIHLGQIDVPCKTPGLDPITAAKQFMSNYAFLWAFNKQNMTIGDGLTRSHLTQNITSFPVLFQELPVFFKHVAIQLGSSNSIRRIAAVIPTINNNIDKHPGINKDALSRWAKNKNLMLSNVTIGWLQITSESLKPVLKVDAVKWNHSHEPTTYFLSAVTMRVVHTETLIDKNDPLGTVFEENPVTTPDPIMKPLLHLDEPFDKLSGTYAHVEQCIDKEKCVESLPVAKPDLHGNFSYTPNLEPDAFDDSFAEVNAYHNISSINAWARENLGWNELFGEETWILVKVGYDWYNAAFYRGNKDTDPYIVLGQGDVDMAYDSDVAYHEFGHAINRSIRSHPSFIRDNFGVNFAPFGIEEGGADIWAQTFANDPIMNSYVHVGRTADNDLVCPDDIRAEGHLEARILSAVGWNIRQRIGDKAWNQIIYRTLFFLESNAGFKEWILGLSDSAQDLANEESTNVLPEHAQIIIEEGTTRGLLDADCQNRIVPLHDGKARRVYGYGRNSTQKHNRPMGLQWKITPPEGIEAFRLYLNWRYPDDVDPGYKVHISRNKPVEVHWLDVDEIGESDPEFEVVADQTFDEAPTSIDFPITGLEPLTPNESIYILLSADADTGILVIDVEALFLSDQPIAPTDSPIESPHYQTTATSWTPRCSTKEISEQHSASLISQVYSLFFD